MLNHKMAFRNRTSEILGYIALYFMFFMNINNKNNCQKSQRTIHDKLINIRQIKAER